MRATNKQVPIKTGKVAPHKLSWRSRQQQAKTLSALQQGENLAGGERHYGEVMEREEKRQSEVRVGGYSNDTLLMLEEAGVKLIDYEAAVGAYGLRVGRPTYLKPVKDEAERKTVEVDNTEQNTVRPKAPQMSDKPGSAGTKSARRSTTNATDPIHTCGGRDMPKPLGLFSPEWNDEEFEAAKEMPEFKAPRITMPVPRGERHTIPMDRNGKIYACPVRVKHGQTDDEYRRSGYITGGPKSYRDIYDQDKD